MVWCTAPVPPTIATLVTFCAQHLRPDADFAAQTHRVHFSPCHSSRVTFDTANPERAPNDPSDLVPRRSSRILEDPFGNRLCGVVRPYRPCLVEAWMPCPPLLMTLLSGPRQTRTHALPQQIDRFFAADTVRGSRAGREDRRLALTFEPPRTRSARGGGTPEMKRGMVERSASTTTASAIDTS
jgi:hypothetical protein